MVPFREKSKIGIRKVVDWYGRYERPISSISLVGGFVFDALTLKRIDMFWENFWILGHVVGIAIFMVLVHMFEKEEGAESDPSKMHFWFVNGLQFLFGGVLSVFLVFYFRSGDLATSWPFILLLTVAFLANEHLKRHFVRLTFQMSLFFLSIFCCAIYLLPVVLHKIGPGIFVLSGILSLVIIVLFLNIIMRVHEERFFASRKMMFTSIALIFITFNILYFTNLIPPIPLSINDSGLFYSIQKSDGEGYIAEYEPTHWWDFFHIYDDFHLGPNDAVYAYSAVFSPSSLNTNVVHEWQFYNKETGQWVNKGSILLPVVGGREGGFRTFSVKSDLEAGKWRVNVETTRGQLIGRLRFTIIKTAATPKLAIEDLD